MSKTPLQKAEKSAEKVAELVNYCNNSRQNYYAQLVLANEAAVKARANFDDSKKSLTQALESLVEAKNDIISILKNAQN